MEYWFGKEYYVMMRRTFESNSGFSLVEAAVAVGVFAIVATGIATTTMLTSRIAYENIYENTAYMVAQAYAEQIKSISFDEILRALDDPVEYKIPTESLSYGSGLDVADLNADDPLIFGVPMEKEVVVDLEEASDGSVEERVMDMRILAEGRNLVETTSCWGSIEIVLDFEWDVVTGSGISTHNGQIRLVKSNVSEF